MIVNMPRGSDIFRSTCEALVDPVDTTGAQGAGLAKFFRNRYRYECGVFAAACYRGEIHVGKVFSVRKSPERLLVFFPSKVHWARDSKLADIAAGLEDLVVQMKAQGVRTVAIPALGAGLGRLSWWDVAPLITEAAKRMDGEGHRIEIYAPHEEPAEKQRRTP